MKIRFPVYTSIVMILLSVCYLFVMANSSINAKDKATGPPLITSADLDHADVQGAHVKYQLTDEEIQGAPLTYSNGSIVRRMNAVILIDYTAIDGRRDEQGRRLARVRVDRPDYLGGEFERDAPYDSGRSPGSIDTLQPGDLVH